MSEPDYPDLTWRRLRDLIDRMVPAERLDDPVQIMPWACFDEPKALDVAFDFNTVGYYSTAIGDDGSETPIPDHTRGVIDNAHHPEHFVLLSDRNPYDPDGNTYYTLTPEGAIGNKTGRNYGEDPFAPEAD